jgi:hypothetical protein
MARCVCCPPLAADRADWNIRSSIRRAPLGCSSTSRPWAYYQVLCRRHTRLLGTCASRVARGDAAAVPAGRGGGCVADGPVILTVSFSGGARSEAQTLRSPCAPGLAGPPRCARRAAVDPSPSIQRRWASRRRSGMPLPQASHRHVPAQAPHFVPALFLSRVNSAYIVMVIQPTTRRSGGCRRPRCPIGEHAGSLSARCPDRNR